MKRKDLPGPTPGRFLSTRFARNLIGMDAPNYLWDFGTGSIDGHTHRSVRNICDHRQGRTAHTLTGRPVGDPGMVNLQPMTSGGC